MHASRSLDLPPGPFTKAQAHRLGISDRRLRTSVQNHQLRRPFRGVYVDAGIELTDQVRVEALELVVPGHAVVCDRTAAWLHGIDVFGFGDKDLVMPVELCSLRGHNPTNRTGVDGRTRDLQPCDVIELGRVRVTTPLRTALDLGCGLTRTRALAALDAFRREFGLSLSLLHDEVLRYSRRRGVVQLRQLVPLSRATAESPRESATRLIIHDAGLPEPRQQWWVEVHGVPTYRLDLAYPHLRIAIEYDGREFHDRKDDQRQYDDRRRGWLRANGWTVIVVDSGNLFTAQSGGWVRELREALTSRTARLRWTR